MNIRHAALLAGVLATTTTAASLLAQGPRQDGQWEVTTEMQMPGMPAGGMQPIVNTQCISKADAADPQKFLPKGQNESGCAVSDYKLEGNKTTWSLKCDGPPAIAGTGEIVYSQDAYTGSMKLNMGGQAMTVKYSAKRLGDCVK